MIVLGKKWKFVSELCDQVVNKLVWWITRANTEHEELRWFVYGPKTQFFSISIKITLRHPLQCSRLSCNLGSIWLLFGAHCTVMIKKNTAGAKELYKETQRGLNGDWDWHWSRRRREGCNQSWLCVDSGTIHRSLKKLWHNLRAVDLNTIGGHDCLLCLL